MTLLQTRYLAAALIKTPAAIIANGFSSSQTAKNAQMKKIFWPFLLSLLLAPALLMAKPVLLMSSGGCMIYWQVLDDCNGLILGQGSYWDPGCQMARSTNSDSTTANILLPSQLAGVREQVRTLLHLSQEEVEAMPALSGQFDEVITPGTDKIPAELRAKLVSLLGSDANMQIAETRQYIPNFGEVACYVSECSLFPVPFTDSFTLRFACEARKEVTKAVRITAISFADQTRQHILYKGEFHEGLTELGVRTQDLPAGRYIVQVSIGRYARAFDVLKQ